MNGQKGFESSLGYGGQRDYTAQGMEQGMKSPNTPIGGILSSVGNTGGLGATGGLGTGTNAADPSRGMLAQQLGGNAYRQVNADGSTYNDPNDPSSDPNKQMTWGDWQKYQNRPQGNPWQSPMTM